MLVLKMKPKQYAPFEKKEYAETKPTYSSKVFAAIDVNLADTSHLLVCPGLEANCRKELLHFGINLVAFIQLTRWEKHTFCQILLFRK